MSDLTQSGLTLILQLVNDLNSDTLTKGPLTSGNVTLGNPSGSPDGSSKNTQITLDSVDGGPYYGTQTVIYDRLDIGGMFTGWGINPSIGGNSYINASDTLASINSAYNLNLQPGDIIDGPLNIGSYPATASLEISPNSLVYTGTLSLSLPGSTTELSSIVTNDVLTGFTLPSGPPSSPGAWLP
jgi:hypothetical protein